MKTKLLETLGSVGTGIIGFATMDGYRRSLLNDDNKEKIEQFRSIIANNEKKSIDLKAQEKDYFNMLEQTNGKITPAENYISNNIEDIKHTSDLLKEKLNIIQESNISKEVSEIMQKDINNLVDQLVNKASTNSKIIEKVSEIIDLITKDGSSSSKYFENFWDKLENLISSSTTQELGAIGHIFMSIFILLCLSSIVSVFYGDTLIRYFKLEDRIPKLARFIQLRRQFQQYYFLLNVILIVLALLYIIYINLCVLYINS